MWGLAGKENIWDLLDVGIGKPLMQGCSNVHIIGEFPSFLMSHLMQLFGIPSRMEISIKGLQEEEFFCANGYYWFFQRGGLVRCFWDSDFCDYRMDEAYEEG